MAGKAFIEWRKLLAKSSPAVRRGAPESVDTEGRLRRRPNQGVLQGYKLSGTETLGKIGRAFLFPH